MTYYFFGDLDRVMSQVAEECLHCVTPTDEHCFFCHEAIEQEDRGLFWCNERIRRGVMSPAWEPIHAECELVRVFGRYTHQLGQCACYGGKLSHLAFAGTKREESFAVLQIINARRFHEGAPLLW